jgi:hypothetical protein
MQLDREDHVPPGSALAPTASLPRPLDTPAAWFADKAPAVAVVVKKRRVLDVPLAAPGDAPTDGALSDDRQPRVFVLPKEPSAQGDAEAAAGATAQPAQAATPGASTALPRRHRRRLPEHRPSPVVVIVPPPAPAEPAEPTTPDTGFVLDLPPLDTWRELQATLQGVRRLVHDAESARRWACAPTRARRRRAP